MIANSTKLPGRQGATARAAPACSRLQHPSFRTHSISKRSVLASRTASRRAVVVHANLFSRVVRVVKSYTAQLVSSAEDPEKILDQAVVEMQEDLIKMRQASAQVLASQKQLEAKYKQAQSTADDWLRRAELAVQKNEDELAREALKRRKSYQDQAESFKSQMGNQQQATEQLIANTRTLENKLMEARSKKDTLKARAASAKTSKQIQEMLGGLNTSNAGVAFEKMEEKVMGMEAEAESITALAGDTNMDAKFAALEGNSVDDELSALKRGALKGATPAALPEGRPLKDAIDLELDQLRNKARE